MICGFEVPAEHIEEELDLILVDADLQFQDNLLNNFEELATDTTLAAIATARKSIQEVSRSLLPLSQRSTEPLNHVKEELMTSLEAHSMVQQVKSCHSTKTIDETIFKGLIDLLIGKFRLEKPKDGN